MLMNPQDSGTEFSGPHTRMLYAYFSRKVLFRLGDCHYESNLPYKISNNILIKKKTVFN